MYAPTNRYYAVLSFCPNPALYQRTSDPDKKDFLRDKRKTYQNKSGYNIVHASLKSFAGHAPA